MRRVTLRDECQTEMRSDPIIEGITNPEPANAANDENSTNLEIDERRESLAILAS